ncbi:Imm70 family immunity protein [Asticcacaulis solisilvae]|uniref:Imm70 family immunity protein n=1 Tax=Asticcacaulis solisilvae TaxID=1217274 RepID=UPI003FD741E2
MGLYLTIFDNGDELDGVEVGAYSDFSIFRNAVVKELEDGVAGSKYPTLILHSDCDGKWSPEESAQLEKELETISDEFRHRPPISLSSDWQKQVAKSFGLRINSLYDCFFDVDGEPLLDRLINLARLSQSRNLPIIFQ